MLRKDVERGGLILEKVYKNLNLSVCGYDGGVMGCVQVYKADELLCAVACFPDELGVKHAYYVYLVEGTLRKPISEMPLLINLPLQKYVEGLNQLREIPENILTRYVAVKRLEVGS